MEFTNIMSNWQNEGVAPSADLQANGFQPGQRPPASVFNWQWHRTSAAITELQEKLTGVASNAEVNQNAFSNVKVGDTTIEADTKTDTLTLEAGTNISITPDAANDKVTINNTYSLPQATSSALGGVKAVAKTDDMTSSVGIDSNGQLWSEAGGGGGTALVDDAGVLSWGDVDSDIDTSIFSSYAVKEQAVLNVAQTLTDEQKAQARENIGAASAADMPDVSGKLNRSGDTMTGVLTAQNNASYTTKQVRNIFLIADGASLPSGANGDICLVYTP